MPLIDRTYFDGDLLLSVSEASNKAAVDAAIVSYEDEYLQKALGPSLYVAFIAGLTATSGGGFSSGFSSGFQVGGIADRWKWIRDGHIYTCNGRTHIWTGLINAKKQSPIAAYVYWQYRAINTRKTTSLGSNQPKTENSVIVSPRLEMVRAWNKMVDWTEALNRMIVHINAGATYPEYQRCEIDRDVYSHQNPYL